MMQHFQHYDFNSIKVQLILLLLQRYQNAFKFQFHKGTINTFYESRLAIVFTNFNSIKVQLIQSQGEMLNKYL